MTEGYTWRDHVNSAEVYLFSVKQDTGEIESTLDRRSALQAARASITRALILLPKVKDEYDAA